VRRLGLQRGLSALYYWLNRPPDGIWRLSLHGTSGAFAVRTAWQLRWLESVQVRADLDPDLEALMTAVRPGDVVYDIGANMGLFSIMLGHRVGAGGLVVSFEPQTQVFEHLQTNIRLNGLQNVRAFRKALGADTEAAFVSIAKESVLSRLRAAEDSPPGPREAVDVVVGDEFVKAEDLPVPRLVKIDVEGAEYGVIRGLTKTLSQPACQMVCCEIHPPLLPAGVTQDTVLTLLRDLGFDEMEIREFGTWSVAVCRREPA
jgi:FkbM family methyltransferase